MARKKYTKAHDLEIERAQINVSVNETKSLVSSWLGNNFDEDEDSNINIPVIQSITHAGLGYEDPESSTAPKSKALEKLKYLEKKRNEELSKQQKKSENDENKDIQSSESEEESKTQTKRTNKRTAFNAVAAYKNKKKTKRK